MEGSEVGHDVRTTRGPGWGICTVEPIRGTNTLIFHAGQNGMVVALE